MQIEHLPFYTNFSDAQKCLLLEYHHLKKPPILKLRPSTFSVQKSDCCVIEMQPVIETNYKHIKKKVLS